MDGAACFMGGEVLVKSFVERCYFLPGVVVAGEVAQRFARREWSGEVGDEFVGVAEIEGAVVGRLAVVDNVVGQNGAAEEHCLDERGVCAPGAVAVNVGSGVVAECKEDVEVVDVVEEGDVGEALIFGFERA